MIFFSKLSFSSNSFRNIIRVSNYSDPDQDQRSIRRPDLAPNCLQWLSANDKRCHLQEQLNSSLMHHLGNIEAYNGYISCCFNPLPHRGANRADPDQAALIRAA